MRASQAHKQKEAVQEGWGAQLNNLTQQWNLKEPW